MDATGVNTIKGRTPLRASYAIRSALARRGKSVGSISYAYSAKTHRDVVLSSDLELCHFLSLEGRQDVETYDLDPDRILTYIENEGYVGSKPDAIITLRSGHKCLVEVKYQNDAENDPRASLQFQVQKKEAIKIGADWYIYTEDDARNEERFLHDWLQIVTTLSATVDTTYRSLEKQVAAGIEKLGAMTLRDILLLKISSWEEVFTCVFQLCQRGKFEDDLRDNPLSWATVIRVVL